MCSSPTESKHQINHTVSSPLTWRYFILLDFRAHPGNGHIRCGLIFTCRMILSQHHHVLLFMLLNNLPSLPYPNVAGHVLF